MSYDKTDEKQALERGLTAGQLQQIQLNYGLSNRAASQLSKGSLRRLLWKLNHPDRPRAREAFKRLQDVDETGTIPPRAMQNALQQLDSARVRAFKASVAGLPCGPAGAALAPTPEMSALGAGITGPAGWTSIGPGNIGGRTRSIVIDPRNPDRIWAGSVGGGVWRSDDGGGHWQPVDDMMANLAVSCMVMDPTRSDCIYAGTGEGFSNVDAIRGAGIFRTVDGIQWTQLPATTGEEFHFVNRLAMSKSGTVLLAATTEGIFRSADRERMAWSNMLPGIRMGCVAFDPGNSRRAVAGGLRNGRAYSTRNGGRTWHEATTATPWSGRVELAYAVHDPRVVYASVQMTSGELWRSTDGGFSYTRVGGRNINGVAANFLGGQGWYDNTIWAGDPTDADLVLVGGIDLWRSTDGGNTLRRISQWQESRSVHADHHVIVSHPDYDGTRNRQIFCGNDGGVYRGSNARTVGRDRELRAQGWTRLVNNYGVTQFYGAAGNAETGTIIGGAQDNGTLAFTPAAGSQAWNEILGGDGGFVAADPTDPRIFYGEYIYLNLYRNTDGATTDELFWENYISGSFYNPAIPPEGDWDWKPAPFTIPDAKNQNALFIAPFVLDPNNADRLLAGGMDLWRSNDAKTPNTHVSGPSWASIKTSVGSEISAIAVAAGDSDQIWVGHVNGEIYRTTDGTAELPHWQLMGESGPNPLRVARYCTRIVIDPRRHRTIYITFSGYREGNVWKTTDGGATWSNLGGTLPEAPVRCLAIHPRRSHFLYLGTEVGVFTSEDAGATWSPTNEGPTNCPVYDLIWMDETLVCATHGRGMFQIDLSRA